MAAKAMAMIWVVLSRKRLRYSLDLPVEADAIENAVAGVIEDGYRTADILTDPTKEPLTCTAMTEKIMERI